MSAAVKSFVGGLARFANPAFYKSEYANVVKSVHGDMQNGSVRPLFQAILLVGVVGYTMEYMAIGRTLWPFSILPRLFYVVVPPSSPPHHPPSPILLPSLFSLCRLSCN
jgi:hypothetical protein